MKFIDEKDNLLYNREREVIMMDLYKDLIRKRIKEKFGTIEQFSKHTGIPRTTINFILKNGVSASSFGMVSTIFSELDIHGTKDNPVVMDEEVLELVKLYTGLDEVGKHTVSSVAETEYRRLHPKEPGEALLAAYGSIADGSPLSEEEKIILNLIKKIKG